MMRTALATLLVVWSLAVASASQGGSTPLAPAIAAPSLQPATPAEFKQRIREILAAPEFQTEKTRYRWEWRGEFPQREERDEPTFREAFLERLAQFLSVLAELLEALLWAAAVLALVLLYVYRDRWLSLTVRGRRQRMSVPPTQISGLDVRPESLPADIAGAAREAWKRGDRVAALSLLYRGALSSLVRTHRCDVPASATEEDCLKLVTVRGGVWRYFERLTRNWQGLAYGGRRPAEDLLAELTAEYDTHFGTPAV